jgi:hypothetical protein
VPQLWQRGKCGSAESLRSHRSACEKHDFGWNDGCARMIRLLHPVSATRSKYAVGQAAVAFGCPGDPPRGVYGYADLTGCRESVTILQHLFSNNPARGFGGLIRVDRQGRARMVQPCEGGSLLRALLVIPLKTVVLPEDREKGSKDGFARNHRRKENPALVWVSKILLEVSP